MQIPFEMNNEFKTLVLQPHWLQYCVDYLPAIVIWLILMVVSGLENIRFVWFFKVIDISLFMFLLYKFISFSRIKYKITSEQLIYKHGMFRHFSDYTELYRIVDYQENRVFFQQIFGLKTVVLTTSDRSTPVIKLTGIASRSKIIDDIRLRVELNRRRKGICEFTNNF